MDNLGLNNDVSVGGRKFHIQTTYSDSENQIIANAFNEGQVVDSREVAVADEIPMAELKERMESIHQELITEMEILYYMSEKVKTVRHASSANKLGLLFLQKQLLDEAVEHFKLALEIDPQFSEVYANYGKALLMDERYDQAIEILQQGARQAPGYADMQYYLGLAHLYKEAFEQAEQHLEKALALNPKYGEAHFNLGVARLARYARTAESEPNQTEVDEAITHLRFDDGNLCIPNRARLVELAEKGAFAEVVDAYLLNKPRDLLAKFMNVENEFYLKFMYGGKGKDDSFISAYIEDLQELVEENPAYADVHNNLGVAHLIQCRNLFLKALEEFRAALKINPNFKKADKNLKLAENDGKGFLILLRAILK